MKSRLSEDDQGPGPLTALRPDAPFYAIGDIHGRLDLLESLLSRINPDDDQRLVFLGDYVDRGPNTADTLVALHEMSNRRPDDIICLMGNHEKMLLAFVDDPLGKGSSWLRNGGAATLRSFGIDAPPDRGSADQILAACDALESAIPQDLMQWLRQLPLSWNSGNIWCVHAAMDPAISPSVQSAGTMLWGHRDFLKTDRLDDAVVVHGHTTVVEPTRHFSRIAIDTGAHQSNRLTAAHLSQNACQFVCT